MVRRVPIEDVFMMAVPADVDPSRLLGTEQMTSEDRALLATLERLATGYVAKQYRHIHPPPTLEIEAAEWCITDNIEEIDRFQPGDGCPACMAGNDQAKAFLRDNPGRWIAMANLRYTEVWRK